MSPSLLFTAYRIAAYPLAIVMPAWLRWRLARGLELPERWREKLGEPSRARPEGALIWCHAASIGEAMSVLPLISALTERGARLLLTTGTVTSARLIAPRLPAGALHQFAPLDHAPWIERFVDHWRPQLALRVESEIWPTTLERLARRAVPTVQVNGRLSRRASEGWRRAATLSRGVFGSIALVLAQSDTDAERFRSLGSPKVVVTGNLKLSQPPLPFDHRALDAAAAQLAGRACWLAASLHPGEDQIVARAHGQVRQRHPDACLIAVPRHPGRGGAMAETFARAGWAVARRSQGQALTPTTDVYVADTLGELGLFYRLCPVVFMGKSFAVGGGQNPAEPAQIGCALVWGPDMSNFEDLADALVARGAATGLRDHGALGPAIADLLADRARVEAMMASGRALIGENAGALEKTLRELAPYLPGLAFG